MTAAKNARTVIRTGSRLRMLPGIFLTMALMLAASLVLCAYSSTEPKVYDDAELLSDEEEQTLESQISDLAGRLSLDIIIVTADSAGGKSAQRYADDFYDDHGFGYDQEGSGILLLILVERNTWEYYVSTAGNAITLYSDDDIEDMLDDIWPGMRDGDYYKACTAFLTAVQKYGDSEQDNEKDGTADTQQGAVPVNPDAGDQSNAQSGAAQVMPEPGTDQGYQMSSALSLTFTGSAVARRLLISVIVAAVIVGVRIYRLRVHKAPGGHTYMRPGSDRVLQRMDRRTHTTVVTRPVGGRRGTMGGPGGPRGGIGGPRGTMGGPRGGMGGPGGGMGGPRGGRR